MSFRKICSYPRARDSEDRQEEIEVLISLSQELENRIRQKIADASSRI